MNSGLKFYLIVVGGIISLVIILGIVKRFVKSDRLDRLFDWVADFLYSIWV